MKKLVIAFLILGIALVSAQNTDWARIHEIEEYFKLFEVNVEVWHNPTLNTINFEDGFSRDFDEMIFQWSYLMTAFEFMLEDSGQVFEDLEIETMIYSLFLVIDNRVSKHEEPNLRYDLHMERWWCIEFFQANRRNRQEMIYYLFDEHYALWFPLKRQF